MPDAAGAGTGEPVRGARLTASTHRQWFCPRVGSPKAPARGLLSRAWLAAALALAVLPLPALAQPEANPGDAVPNVAAEIRSAVGGKIKAFYKTRGYWPFWVQDGALGPEADRLIELLETADLDGLKPADYDPDDLREIIARAREGSAEALAAAEVELSNTFADYVRDMRDVRRAPSVKMVYLDTELAPERLTRLAVLRTAGVAPSLADYLDTMGWMNPVYGQLRAALADYRAKWTELPQITIPSGSILRAGVKDDRVPLLRQRLGLPEGTKFDKPLAAKLRAFQAAHGLPADGIAGDATIAVLNREPAYYERILRLNLDRARLLPGTRKRHIIVDAAAARLWMYEDGEVKGTMRVIVGKPTEPTPMLAGMMRYAVVNPYWNVPQDLVQHRIAQKVLDGASFSDMGYEALSDWTAYAQVLDPAQIDWAAVAAGTRELRVRQLPGKTNAMGRMKFMFPNDLGIYLHDTPDKELFNEKERRFSSGCVRLEDAPRLAKWLFGKPLEAPSDVPEQQVYLNAPMPVYITYLTAAPEKNGIAFREDAYGRDAMQVEQLAGR